MEEASGPQERPETEAPSLPARAILFLIALLGLAIIGLSFSSWVKFENVGTDIMAPGDYVSFSIPGTEIGRVVGDDYSQPADVADQETNPCSCRGDVGDGYITAALGAIIVAGAVAGLVWPRLVRAATLVVALSALAALVVAGWNAVTEWQAVGAPDLESNVVELSGDVTPQLYLLTAFSAVAAVLCGLVWALTPRVSTAEDETHEEEQVPEGANGWA
jgi:hypothetical protein